MNLPRRRVAAATTAVLGAAIAAAAATTSAQDPAALPTLTIALQSGTKAPVVDASAVRPGATEVVATAPGRNERSFVLARLREGTTVQDVQALENRRLSERQVDRLGKTLTTFVAQGSAARDRPARAKVDLAPGTYVALDISNDRRQPQVAFEITGDRTTAQLPAHDATVDMRDYKWAKSQKTLPAKGTLRVRNRGKQLHFMLAFPTSSSRNASRLQALLRSRNRSAERRAERLIAGPPSEPVGLISPGVENKVDVDLRPGNYVLVCFYGSPASRNRQHNQLGMARKVQFR